MAIYKRGGVYWYEFLFKGTRYRESTHSGNQNTARTIESARRTGLAKGEVGILDRSPAPTLREFSVEFLKQIELECASKPATIAFYSSKTKRLLQNGKLVDLPLDQIDEDAVEGYKRARRLTASRRKIPMSPASVNRELATLRRLMRMARDWDRIISVPKIRLLRGETSREFVLSKDQEPIYLDALTLSMRDLATFMIDTGLRVGEAINLDWSSVNLRETPAYVRVRPVHAKNSKTRTVPLTPRAKGILDGKQERAGLVFRGVDGGRLSHTWLDQQNAAVRTKLAFPADFVLHSLRHTFGTRLGETGADAFTIMELMGHSSITVSQKYVHPSTESKRLAIERLGGAWIPTKSPTPLKLVGRKKAATT